MMCGECGECGVNVVNVVVPTCFRMYKQPLYNNSTTTVQQYHNNMHHNNNRYHVLWQAPTFLAHEWPAHIGTASDRSLWCTTQLCRPRRGTPLGFDNIPRDLHWGHPGGEEEWW